MVASATRQRAISAVVLSAIIALSLHASQASGEQEFHVERFLRERDEWLQDTFPVQDADLDAEIAAFALPPDDSTVRDAKTIQCKRQIVHTHRRHKAGQTPQHFQNSCPTFKGTGQQSPSKFAVLPVRSHEELDRAKSIIEATESSWRKRHQRMRQSYRFMLAVDEDAGEEGKLLQGATALARTLPKTSVIQAASLEQDGVPDTFGMSTRAAAVPSREAEKRVRFAYAIFVSPNDAPWRIYRLLKALYHVDDFFFLHFDGFRLYADGHDAASDEEANTKAFQAIVELCRPFSDQGNLKVQGIFDVSWGGVSMLNAELGMAQALLLMGTWDYLINLSSTDLPLRTRDEMRFMFESGDMYGKNFLWGVKQNHDHQAKRGLRHDFTECESHSFRVNDEAMLPIGVELHGGSSWFVLHRDFVSWLDGCLSGGFHNMTLGECELPGLFLDYAQSHLSFEELYFHTVIHHSPYCGLVVPDADLRWIKWEREKGETDGCLHFEEVDWCGNSPRYMTADEWQQGRDKKPLLLFSRKYRDPNVYDHMDSVLGVDSKSDMPEGLRAEMARATEDASLRGKTRGDNMAQSKRATSSSYQEPTTPKYAPHNLVDGDLHTRWSSAFSNDHFVQLILHWETAYAKQYVVQVSADMEAWSEVYQHVPPAGRSRARFQLKHTIPLGDKGRGIRGVKVVMQERATRWGYSMWELEAIGECQQVEGGVEQMEIRDDAPVL